MNETQKNKVVQLRVKGLGYRKIANNIKGINREQVRYLINSNRFKEKYPELVDTDNSIANK
jgi:orotate phosphoribosyltransferase-like protein